MLVTPTALMRPDRSKQCSLFAVLHTLLRICICVTNYDLSANIHYVVWAACTDTMPALPPLFHGRTGWAESFLQVLVTGKVTNHKQKIPSQVYTVLP